MTAVTRRTATKTILAGAAAAAIPAKAMGQAGEGAAPHPLMLWYRQPARVWTEALPVGNGTLGAMVFGGIAEERLQLNEATLWGGGPYDPANPNALAAMPELRRLIFAGRFAEAEAFANANVMAKPIRQMSYQALGDLHLRFPGLGEAAHYQRALDLDSALATTSFTVGDVRYTRQVIAAPDDRVIAVQLSASREGALDVDVALTSPQKSAVTRVVDGDTLLMTGSNTAEHGVAAALRFASRVVVLPEGGRLTVEGDRLLLRGAHRATLLIAMATSYRRYDDTSGNPDALTAAVIAAARRRPFAQIAAQATAAHRRLFRRVSIDLGRTEAADQPTDERIRLSETRDDPALAALYFQFGRYLLIACSRPGGQPATLQGLWNDSLRPPWGSKYTININTEMNYWPAHSTNLGECIEPLVRLVREIAETGARTARTMYGARGWVAHHNTDLWRATAPIDGAKFGLWPTGGAWLCTHLWEHWEYTRDQAFLASVYPLMAGAARFFLDTLQHDPNSGHLVTNPSLSPENAHGHGSSLCAGPTMDMAILRDLFDQTAAAADILGRDADFVAEMRAARAKLAPYRIGKDGQLQEWQADWDADAVDIHHRHVSHLYGLHPSHQITPDDTPELAAAARRSLEIRGDKATGWATAWRINLWARLRDGERAHSILRFLLGPERTYPNMFDAHPPFQIDGNFGGTAGIVEMLLQNRGDLIDLLPALPRAWASGSVTGLRVRGGCQLDLDWRAGELVSATLRPDLAGTRTVRLGDRVCRVSLRPGRAVRLTPKNFTRQKQA